MRRLLKPGRDARYNKILSDLRLLPKALSEVLEDFKQDETRWNDNVRQFNKRYHEQLEKYFRSDTEKCRRSPNNFFMYLGRDINYPSALEGALKLKEIAYIPAEGYPAGEMKHGPIALIDENPWVVCINPESSIYEKMISNIEEIKARGGLVTAIVSKGDKKVKALNLFLYIDIPRVSEILSPFVVILPLQLIAFCVAREFGEDIDQPRNLAKSVTVE
jgi:glutamine---fructose-6-phosphate transaminase (isomerizing)